MDASPGVEIPKLLWLYNVCMLSCVQLFVIPWTVACRLLCPWNFPGKNSEMGCHFLLHNCTVGLNKFIYIGLAKKFVWICPFYLMKNPSEIMKFQRIQYKCLRESGLTLWMEGRNVKWRKEWSLWFWRELDVNSFTHWKCLKSMIP